MVEIVAMRILWNPERAAYFVGVSQAHIWADTINYVIDEPYAYDVITLEELKNIAEQDEKHKKRLADSIQKIQEGEKKASMVFTRAVP